MQLLFRFVLGDTSCYLCSLYFVLVSIVVLHVDVVALCLAFQSILLVGFGVLLPFGVLGTSLLLPHRILRLSHAVCCLTLISALLRVAIVCCQAIVCFC